MSELDYVVYSAKRTSGSLPIAVCQASLFVWVAGPHSEPAGVFVCRNLALHGPVRVNRLTDFKC